MSEPEIPDWWSESQHAQQPKKGEAKIDLHFDDSKYEKDQENDALDDEGNLKETKQVRQKVKDIRMIERQRKEDLARVIDRLPEKNEYFHIVSNGNFDYFKIIPRILQLSKNDMTCYASTWTMNYNNIDELIKLIEVGRITKCRMFVGDYLKKREPLVYEHLKQGLYENGMSLRAFANHSKVIAMSDGENHYTIEMSANFTANRRTENLVMTNSQVVYDFHVKWMEELMT